MIYKDKNQCTEIMHRDSANRAKPKSRALPQNGEQV